MEFEFMGHLAGTSSPPEPVTNPRQSNLTQYTGFPVLFSATSLDTW